MAEPPETAELAALIEGAAPISAEVWADRSNVVFELPVFSYPALVAYGAFMSDIEALALLVRKRLEGPCWKLSRSMLEVSLQLYHFGASDEDERIALGAMINRQGFEQRRRVFRTLHRFAPFTYEAARDTFATIRAQEANLSARLDRDRIKPTGMGSTKDLLDRYGHGVDHLVWNTASGISHGMVNGSFDGLRILGTGKLDETTYTVDRRGWNAQMLLYPMATAVLSIARAEEAMEHIVGWPGSPLYEHVRTANQRIREPGDDS